MGAVTRKELTLLALVIYQAADLWTRLRLAWTDLSLRRKAPTTV